MPLRRAGAIANADRQHHDRLWSRAVYLELDQLLRRFSAEPFHCSTLSAIKRVDYGIFATIQQALEGTFKGGPFELNAANGGITYSDFHDADIPDDVAELLEETRAGLADGSIETGIDPITGKPL